MDNTLHQRLRSLGYTASRLVLEPISKSSWRYKNILAILIDVIANGAK
jgi:hypothetical protein